MRGGVAQRPQSVRRGQHEVDREQRQVLARPSVQAAAMPAATSPSCAAISRVISAKKRSESVSPLTRRARRRDAPRARAGPRSRRCARTAARRCSNGWVLRSEARRWRRSGRGRRTSLEASSRASRANSASLVGGDRLLRDMSGAVCVEPAEPGAVGLAMALFGKAVGCVRATRRWRARRAPRRSCRTGGTFAGDTTFRTPTRVRPRGRRACVRDV